MTCLCLVVVFVDYHDDHVHDSFLAIAAADASSVHG